MVWAWPPRNRQTPMNVINIAHWKTRTVHMAFITALVPKDMTRNAEARTAVEMIQITNLLSGVVMLRYLPQEMRVAFFDASPSVRKELPNPQLTAHCESRPDQLMPTKVRVQLAMKPSSGCRMRLT